jgi:glutathione S-transferase
MKLYYSPGACSLSAHITLRESGLPFEPVLAPTKTHKLQDGTDYYTINPKGYVPALELDNGELLTEVPVVLQYIADQAPAKRLAPAGGMPRYRLQEWLCFISSELHKGFGPLFAPTTPEEYKSVLYEKLARRFDYIERQLAGREYLMGNDFTVADAYLFVITRWAKAKGPDLSGLPQLNALYDRVHARPAVREALSVEGLEPVAK